MYLIAGLGNPGQDYRQTKHNVGFEVIDRLAADNGINVSKSKFKAVYGEGMINGEKSLLIKPLTYMNLSGESIREFMSFYKQPPEKLIVICDDVNLPLGSVRIRPHGSDGGQKGLYNIIYQLGNESFPRVRLGIGPKPDGWDLKNYVLSKFTPNEWELITNAIASASEAVELILKNGNLNDAMNKFNKKVSS